MFRCLSVVNDEGLRSYKAIAFIKSNPDCLKVKSKNYLLSGAFLQNRFVKTKTPEVSLKFR